MYLVMLTNNQKVWVDPPLARQLQMNKKVLFIIGEGNERDRDDYERQNAQEKYFETGGRS
jgi:hypothetical protein